VGVSTGVWLCNKAKDECQEERGSEGGRLDQRGGLGDLRPCRNRRRVAMDLRSSGVESRRPGGELGRETRGELARRGRGFKYSQRGDESGKE
jgi:hypothetical protein